MSEKTMGQVAFEAYRAEVRTAFNGDPIPEWDALDNGAPARRGWEAAATAVSEATIDSLVKLGAEVAANPPVIRQVPTRWQPLSRPVTPGEVQSLPEGVKFAPLPPEAYVGERTSVPVEAGPDED